MTIFLYLFVALAVFIQKAKLSRYQGISTKDIATLLSCLIESASWPTYLLSEAIKTLPILIETYTHLYHPKDQTAEKEAFNNLISIV